MLFIKNVYKLDINQAVQLPLFKKGTVHDLNNKQG